MFWTPLAKIVIFDQYLALASITAGLSRVVNICTYASSVSRDQQTPPRHAWVNVVYDTSLDAASKTTEQNLIVRIGKSKAEVTSNKRLCSMYCTVEANN